LGDNDALDPPGAEAPGGSSLLSCSMTISTNSHKAWPNERSHFSQNIKKGLYKLGWAGHD